MSRRTVGVDEALEHLQVIQERAQTLFVERRSEWEPGGPTRMHLFVLRKIAHGGSTTVTEMADMLKIARPSASQLVNTLLERGWLRIEVAAQDRRRHEVRLTGDGTALLAEHMQKRLSRVRTVLSGLTGAERAQLLELVDRVLGLWESTEGSHDNGR